MFTAANVPFIYNQTTGQFWKFYVTLPQRVNLPSRGSNEVTCHSTVVTPTSCSPNMLAPLNMILIVGVALYIVLCFGYSAKAR